MSVHNGLGTGQSVISGSWGPQDSSSSGICTYSSITAINTSVRDNKNVLEVRLERQQGASFRLSQLEIETLLVRLGIDGSQFEGVSACPEGKPIVLITLHQSVDIGKFMYRNESYIVKEGVRTTTIRPAGNKEVLLTVLGLHPNTKDQAVMRYLDAHGEVNKTERVIHHVFPGTPGSTLCAGKFNGNRSYLMKIKESMGNYHIIDGEKVTIRYPGQEWSCARCHQVKRACPGQAIARNCTAERVLLSTHMSAHWAKIGFKPDTEADSEVDDLQDIDIQVGHTKKELPVISHTGLSDKYRSVIIKGFLPETSVDDILKQLPENSLPVDFSVKSVSKNEKTGVITLSSPEPVHCLTIMENMHTKKFLNRKIFVTSVVPSSPLKSQSSGADGACSSVGQSAPSVTGNQVSRESNPSGSMPFLSSPVLDPKAGSLGVKDIDEFEFNSPIKAFSKNENDKNFSNMVELPNKRKAANSPESTEISRKDKKAAKKEQKSKAKNELKAKMKQDTSSS